jgi:hypothetical protein
MAELLTTRQTDAKDFSDEQKKCIEDAVDEDTVKDGLAALFQGKQDEGYTAMQMKIQACTAGAEGGGDTQ